MELTGKVCIVTGAATGIGTAIAAKFAAEGARVVVDYVGAPDAANALVAKLRIAGGEAVAVQADVSDAAQVATLFDTTLARFGRIDVLVNNAGIEKKTAFVDTPDDQWHRIIGVNLTGPFLCSKRAANEMIAQGAGGRIITISSIHEDVTFPNNAPYAASKGGVRMLMRTIAVELAPHGILVNNIAPGAVFTPIDADIESDPELMKRLLAEIPLARMGKPEEIAEMACFLASDRATYSTGSTFYVDGGMMRQSSGL